MYCEDIRPLLEAYALDGLDAEEHQQVEAHLATCQACRQIVADYCEVLAQIPQALAAVYPNDPPAHLRARILQVAARTPAARPVAQTRPSTPTPPPLHTGVRRRPDRRLARLVASIVALVLTLAWAVQLNVALAHEQTLRERLEGQTEIIFEIVDADNVERTFMRAQAAWTRPNEAPPYGKVFVRPDMPYIVAMGGRLPELPSGQVYRLWLFAGDTAYAVGTLTVNAAGFASLIYRADESDLSFDRAQVIAQPAAASASEGTILLASR
jgi:hypothetical protein